MVGAGRRARGEAPLPVDLPRRADREQAPLPHHHDDHEQRQQHRREARDPHFRGGNLPDRRIAEQIGDLTAGQRQPQQRDPDIHDNGCQISGSAAAAQAVGEYQEQQGRQQGLQHGADTVDEERGVGDAASGTRGARDGTQRRRIVDLGGRRQHEEVQDRKRP